MAEEQGIALDVRKAQLDRREADIHRWEAANRVQVAIGRYPLPRFLSYGLWVCIFGTAVLFLAIEHGEEKNTCGDELGLMSWAIFIICAFGAVTTLVNWRLRDYLNRFTPFTRGFGCCVWLWYLLPPVLGVSVSLLGQLVISGN